MRFRGRQQPPPFMTRRDRSRLVWLGLAFILVLAAIKIAADPATWVFLFPAEADRQSAEPSLSDVSFDVSLSDNGLAADEFRSDASPRPSNHDADEKATTANGEAIGSLIDPAILSNVEDHKLNLRVADRSAYFAILDRLRDLDKQTIAAGAESNATFPAVMIEPNHYRGQVLSIEGTARRIVEIPAGPNEAGFDTLYDIWLFTPESGNNPWRIVAVELPPNVPLGDEQTVPLRVAGVFFNLQGYETQSHKLHVAPVLLAKTVERVRRSSTAIAEFDATPWVLGATAVLLAGLALLMFQFRREDRLFEKTTLDRFSMNEAGVAAPPVENTDPIEFFKQLEQADVSPTERNS